MYVYGDDITTTNKLISETEALSQEVATVSKNIGQFCSNSKNKLVGEVYDAYRSNLEVYEEAYNKLSQLWLILGDNINGANTAFSSYVSACPDGDPVDMRKLPDYRDKQKDYKQKWEYYSEIITKNGPDNDGDGVPDSTYREARDPALAEEYQSKYNDITEKIEYIELLPSEDAKATSALDSISSEIDEFVSNVNSLKESNVG